MSRLFSSSEVESDGLEGVSNYHVVFGVFLLACFIGLLALCGGGRVEVGQYTTPYMMHTCLCNIDPIESHLYIYIYTASKIKHR